MLQRILMYQWRRAWLVASICLALVCGIAAARIMQVHDMTIVCILLVALLLCRRSGLIVALGLIGIAFVCGCWRGTIYVNRMESYRQLEKHVVVLTGVATGDAVYGTHSQLTFDMKDVRTGDRHLIGTVQVSGFGVPMIYSGDTVHVEGKLMLARGNNVARLGFARLQLVRRGNSPIDAMRRRFAAGLQSTIPEPYASFGMGLLIGQRNTLPESVTQQLQMVGLTHIIAVSGYNLTIIIRTTKTLFGKRSRYQYMLICSLLIAGFLLIAGASPSIVRASVVCGLSLATWYYGRELKPVTLILLAAALTAWANPLYAWNNVSWMLSFLAFFGVVVVSPLITNRIYKGRDPPLVAAIILESLAAEMMTLPYILWIFGQMSLVSTLANVLVAAFIPFTMLLCLIAGLAGMWLPAVAGWFAWPATLLMTYMLDVVTLLSRIPHAFVEGMGISVWLMIGCYVVVAMVCSVVWKKMVKNDTITDRNKLQQ